jgi:hypothetical protein
VIVALLAGKTSAMANAGYAPDQDTPVKSYAVLMAVFATLAASFEQWFRSSGRELPDRIDPGDLALVTVASHKAARLIAKDRVTASIRAPFTRYEGEAGPSELSERPRGHGLRRAIGELIGCPYCLGMWTSSALIAGLLVVPRFTRWLSSVLVAFLGSDLLQIAYKKAEDSL